MTAPAQDPALPVRPRDWWMRPSVVLPVMASILVIVMLLAPEQRGGRLGDDRLSAHLAGSLGARGLADVAARFGWHVVLDDSTAAPARATGTTVHAVLTPSVPVTPAQAHRYLDAVRGGDALLVSLGDRSPLTDSLGLRHTRVGGILVTEDPDTATCGPRYVDLMPPLWPDGRVHLYGLRWVRGRPADAVRFAEVEQEVPGGATVNEDAAVGFALGRGRVIAVADPDLLRNDVLRRCRWGADAIAMRMLEWLRSGGEQPRATLAFDEFHQGFGPHRSASSVTARFLSGHPVGRAILQLVLAALVLLLAYAPRPLVPQPRPRTERRDPLEQADALAHAYQQVRATRTATQRLVRGVRMRAERGGARARGASDEQFLDAAATLDPARSADVALVRDALHDTAHSHQLPVVGAALRRIEDSLSTTTITRA